MLKRIVTAIVALGVLIGGIVLWRGAARTSPHEAGQPSASRALDPQARLALLDSSLRALSDGYREMPRDTWDPDYVVRMVGRDPQRLLSWVRDNTYWIPYKGVLRGPVGVLLDRQGNSLDRAILLAALLQKAGYTARLAHGTLEQARALEVLSRLEVARSLEFANMSPNASVQPDASPQFSHVIAELHSRVADQTARLLRMTARPDSSTMRMRAFDSAMQALSDHWWVQLRNGTSGVDLDLLAASPAVLVEAKESFAIAELPSELHHTITLRVIAEQWSDGKLKEHKTLEQVLRPSDLYGHAVSLQFWPSAWFEDDAPGQRHTRAEALKVDSWNATLAVDQNLLVAGILTANGDDPQAPVKGGEFGGFAGAFSNSMGQKPNNENRQLSAVWLEYEIHVPGEKPRVVRRSVFDLLGPAARTASSPTLALDESRRLTRSLALTMKTEILPISSGLSPEFVTALVARNLFANRDLMSYLISGGVPTASADAERALRHAEPPISTLYGLALARAELSRKGQIFIDRPNILTRHLYAAPTADGVALLDATDIVANEVAVGLSVSDPFAARVEQGVLDTNAESLIRPVKGPALNTGDAFAASRSWTGLQSAQVTATGAKLNLPQDVRDQIRSDLGNGYDVVVPERPIVTDAGDLAGWWRVNATTGDVLGMGENGWGVATVEQGAEDSQTARVAPLWIRSIKTFAVAFAVNYGWCVTPLVLKHGGDYISQPTEAWGIQGTEAKLHHSLGIWEGAIKPLAKESQRECVADSIFIAGLTAWLLPIGVAAGAAKVAERSPNTPHVPDVEGGLAAGGGSGSNGGKPAGKTLPGLGPNEPGRPANAEPNPPKTQESPKPREPCADDTQPQVRKDDITATKPTSADYEVQNLERQLRAARADVRVKNDAAIDATAEWVQKMNAFRATLPPDWEGGIRLDPASEAKLQQATNASIEASNRVTELTRALEIARKNANYRSGQRDAAGQKYQIGDTRPNGCGPADPRPITHLDPALYEGVQSGNTDPGLGPSRGTSPGLGPSASDPGGPPTVPDPQFANTQPNYGLPGADPYAPTQRIGGPSQTGKTLPGIGPPGPASQGQSWDGKPCRWCSYMPPNYPDSDPNSQKNPPASGPSGSYQQKTLNGLNGVGGAFGGAPK